MPSASAATLRRQIEASLASRIPSALTPAPCLIHPTAPTGVPAIDALLEGGIPLGAITEMAGPECSGRTSVALSFLAGLTRSGKVCAWIDVSDALDPGSAAAAGVDLSRLLWVRCGAAPAAPSTRKPPRPWPRIEQALRAADLLLQAGGFSAIVLDMAGVAPEHALRVPTATWFRYRAAAERTQAAILLLAQEPCARSSGELMLRFGPSHGSDDAPTVFTGVEHRLEAARRRFQQGRTPETVPETASGKVVPLRKPPQRASEASWHSRAAWAGPR